MADKNPGGRPPKGDAVRSRMVSVRVEPWVVATLDNDRHDGESRADVLTRWAGAQLDDDRLPGEDRALVLGRWAGFITEEGQTNDDTRNA